MPCHFVDYIHLRWLHTLLAITYTAVPWFVHCLTQLNKFARFASATELWFDFGVSGTPRPTLRFCFGGSKPTALLQWNPVGWNHLRWWSLHYVQMKSCSAGFARLSIADILAKGRKSSKDALRHSLLYKINIFLSIHFFIFVDFLGKRDVSYPQNSTIFLEKIGCFWHFFVILFYSVFMQDFGFWLHFYAFIFPFLLFSASYMHVHTSARLLTYMRVRVSASAYARARKKFFYFSKLWTKFLKILFTSLFINMRWT